MMRASRIPAPRFTPDDADRAFAEWGANCGPAAIAAMLLRDVPAAVRFVSAEPLLGPLDLSAHVFNLGIV